jgi:hypothetical protein
MLVRPTTLARNIGNGLFLLGVGCALAWVSINYFGVW